MLSSNGLPVPGARLEIEALGKSAVADKDGLVRLSLPPGQHAVRVSAKGFEDLSETLIADEATAATGFELLLDYRLDEVVVTGTNTEKLAEQAPVRTQVVSREKIESKQAHNLADALEQVAGVRVENTCNNCTFPQVRLNGLDGQFSQILIDGRPVVSSLASVYGLEQIPEEMIERVEVVKGGGSALYGSSAVGGVINVITSRPKTNFANVTGRGAAIGSLQNEEGLSARAGLVNEKRTLALHLFADTDSRDPWDANGDGFSEVGLLRHVNAGAEAYVDLFERGELQLKFHVLREQRRGGDAFDKPEHQAAIAESIQTMRQGGEVRWKQIVSNWLNYELGYGFALTNRDSYYGGGGDVELPTSLDGEITDELRDAWASKQAALGAYGHTRNPVHVADAMVNASVDFLGRMVLTAGLQFQSDHIEDGFPAYDRTIDETYTTFGGIAQADWFFTDWAELVLGARVDSHSALDTPVVSPRAALLLSVGDWGRSRTSFSTGFRAPQVFNEDLHVTIVGGEGVIIYNAEGLKPESSRSLSQQFEVTHPLGALRLRASLNGFFTVIDNAFVLEETDDPSTLDELEFQRINHGQSRVYGSELEVGVNQGSLWSLSAGWSLERGSNSEADPDFETKELFRIPEGYGFFEASARPLKGLELGSSLTATGPMKVPHYAGYIAENRLETTPWFYDWSLRIAYRYDLQAGGYIKPFLAVRNILDSYQEDLDIGRDRDAGYVYGPRLPRSVFAGIKGGF